MTYETIIGSLIVKPNDQPIFSELATTVSLCDEAAGMYLSVEQHGRADVGKILIEKREWPMIKEAIEKLMAYCE